MSKSPDKPQNIRMHIKLAHIEPPSVNEELEFMAAYWKNSKNRGSTIH